MSTDRWERAARGADLTAEEFDRLLKGETVINGSGAHHMNWDQAFQSYADAHNLKHIKIGRFVYQMDDQGQPSLQPVCEGWPELIRIYKPAVCTWLKMQRAAFIAAQPKE